MDRGQLSTHLDGQTRVNYMEPPTGVDGPQNVTLMNKILD